MDQYSYRHWKNQFFNLNQGQKQMEDVTKWIMGGLHDFEALSESFCKLWDIDLWPTDPPDYIKAWNTTTEDVQKLFKGYLDLVGLVSKDEYLALINKFNEMNETVNDQAREISEQENIVADQKKVITHQKKEIEKQKKMVAAKKEKIADQKKQVADLKKQIAGQKKIVTAQQKEIDGQKKIVAELKKEVVGQIKSIKQLQKRASA